MKISFTTAGNALSMLLNGSMVSVPKNHLNYKAIAQILKDGDDGDFQKILNLIDMKKDIQAKSAGKCVLIENQVFYDGKAVHNNITRRVLDHVREGLPFDGLLLCLENCKLNPSMRAGNEVFDFMDHRGIPVTEDGCFLAYKAVTSNWTDKRTGTVDNSIGAKPHMDRNLVNDDWGLDCAEGFHVGSLKYVFNFGNNGGDRVIIVKVNPKDVVSVPREQSAQKCRVTDYEVISEFRGELNQATYSEKEVQTFNAVADYGVKPSGQKFWNVRGPNGSFVKKAH